MTALHSIYKATFAKNKTSVITKSVLSSHVDWSDRGEMQYVDGRSIDPYGTGGTYPPNIYEGGTSMVMSPQYFRSDVV